MSTPVFRSLPKLALALARAGYAVVPVAPGTKDQPLVAWGAVRSAPDLAQVGAWWAETPDANIALLTGPSGVVVLDVDPRNGGINEEWMALAAPRAFTPSGGTHHFFAAPADSPAPPTKNGILPGVDVKGATGYVIFAGSRLGPLDAARHWTMAGTWLKQLLRRDLPPWSRCADLLVKKMGEAEARRPSETQKQQWVQEVMEYGAPRGQRNDVLTRLAGYFAGRLPLDVAQSILWVWLRETCPWDEGDWGKPQCDDLVARIFARAEANAPTTVRFTPGESLFDKSPAVTLPFHTAKELAETAITEPDWLLPGMLVKAAVHNLHGQPKSGKSTLIGWMVNSLCSGESFAGYDAPDPTPVVWLTEQPRSTFDLLMDDCDLRGLDNLYVLAYLDAREVDWPSIVKKSVDFALSVGAKMIVVDTLSKWARMWGDAENCAGEVLAVLDPLQYALEHKLAIVLVTHDRKASGSAITAGRGSNALAGECDILIQFLRTPPSNVAKLVYEGRIGAIPDEREMRLEAEGYIPLTEEAKRDERIGKRLRRCLSKVGRLLTDKWRTSAEIADHSKQSRQTIYKLLQELRDFEETYGFGVVETETRPNRQMAYRRPVTAVRFV